MDAGTLQGTTATLTGAITDNANVTFDQNTGGTYGGVLSGSGSLTKAGTGTLTLTGANGYGGGTNVTGGTLSISSDGNLGNGGTVALGDGTGIDFTAGGTYSHDITVAGDPTFTVGTGLTVIQSGQIADGATPGDVEVKGGGTLVLSNAGNSFSGGTTVSEDSTLSHRRRRRARQCQRRRDPGRFDDRRHLGPHRHPRLGARDRPSRPAEARSTPRAA